MVAGWYSESSIKPYSGPSVLLSGVQPRCWTRQQTLPDVAQRRGEPAMREASPTGTRPTGHPVQPFLVEVHATTLGAYAFAERRRRKAGFALRTRDDSESCLGRARAVPPAKCQVLRALGDPQDLDWSRESSAFRRRVRG